VWSALFSRARQQLANILLIQDTAPTGWWLGLTTTVLGLWLLCPMDTFAAGAVYQAMETLMPEWAWGCLWILVGLNHLRGLVLNGAHGNRWRWTSLAMVVLWTFQASLVFISASSGIGVASYGLLALQSAWLYYRLGASHV
jgi:hypothetical protein